MVSKTVPRARILIAILLLIFSFVVGQYFYIGPYSRLTIATFVDQIKTHPHLAYDIKLVDTHSNYMWELSFIILLGLLFCDYVLFGLDWCMAKTWDIINKIKSRNTPNAAI